MRTLNRHIYKHNNLSICRRLCYFHRYMIYLKHFSFKKFGYLYFQNNLSAQLTQQDLSDCIKVVFVQAGGHVVVDFTEYHLTQDAFFFINTEQYFSFANDCCGTLLFYNRDFYCVEIHDKEVACDGILFHNVYEVPVVFMDAPTSASTQTIIEEIKNELQLDDTSIEEMLRILLKQIIIKCTRIWKQEHRLAGAAALPEVTFYRSFSQLVEKHFTKLHTVADFAELLHISPKALNKRITRYSDTTPNDIIKNRIMVEAKRLLVHANLSIKEICYELGYEDPSYFTRLFTKQASISPQQFRVQYKKV